MRLRKAHQMTLHTRPQDAPQQRPRAPSSLPAGADRAAHIQQQGNTWEGVGWEGGRPGGYSGWEAAHTRVCMYHTMRTGVTAVPHMYT
jgi:hypothetical protein